MEFFTCLKCGFRFAHPHGCVVRGEGDAGCLKCWHPYVKWTSFKDEKSNAAHDVRTPMTTEETIQLFGP